MARALGVLPTIPRRCGFHSLRASRKTGLVLRILLTPLMAQAQAALPVSALTAQRPRAELLSKRRASPRPRFHPALQGHSSDSTSHRHWKTWPGPPPSLFTATTAARFYKPAS